MIRPTIVHEAGQPIVNNNLIRQQQQAISPESNFLFIKIHIFH
jgi:hypothetical protein